MSLLALLDPFADHTDFPTLPYTPGGDSHMKQTGMLVRNFEFNP